MNEIISTVGLIVIQSVALLVSLLVVTAFLLYADRKVWAAVQMRRGPNVVGPWGLFQSFADLLKFVFKEVIIPDGANKGVFILAPLVTALLSLAAWAVIPLGLCFYLQAAGRLEASGIWLAIVLGHFTRCVLSAARFHQGRWKHIQVDAHS